MSQDLPHCRIARASDMNGRIVDRPARGLGQNSKVERVENVEYGTISAPASSLARRLRDAS